MEHILEKFFTNKIQSTEKGWPEYLIAVATTFQKFDGLQYNYDEIVEEFSSLSSRDVLERDPSDFRDEFGAYGGFLGIYYVDKTGTFRLTEAAKYLLCGTEPDVEAFCRVQMSLFQYPNGLGVRYNRTTGIPATVEHQVLADTVREVKTGAVIIPFRVLLLTLLEMASASGVPPSSSHISYREFFEILNDTCVNAGSNSLARAVVTKVRSLRQPKPAWVFPVDARTLAKFSRNFHILERTGLVKREASSLKLDLQGSPEEQALKQYQARLIANLTMKFTGFDGCTSPKLSHDQIGECVKRVIMNCTWGPYYDGASQIPSAVLNVLAPETSLDMSGGSAARTSLPYTTPSPARPPVSTPPSFPSFTPKVMGHPFVASKGFFSTSPARDPELTRIARERANRAHSILVEAVATALRVRGFVADHNEYIDLHGESNGRHFIFEMKSCERSNMLNQIRKGVSQLYEYKYRSGLASAILCLVLEQEPANELEWVKDYLVLDRKIQLCWQLGDTMSFDYPPACQGELSDVFG